jgi:type I restriction enzyme S subunit
MILPESWVEVSIGQVCDIYGGGTPDRSNLSYFGGGIPWATPTDVTKLDSLNLSNTSETLTEEGLKNSSAKLLPVGSVLLTSRATIGRTAIIEKPTCTNQGFVNLVCNPDVISNEYLARLLHAWTPYLESRATGATFKEISRSTIAKINIPLPTLSEQKRIVAILQQLEAIENERRRALKSVSSIAREHFIAMFGHPAENPHGFKVEKFSKLGTLDRGISKHRPRDAAHLFNGPYPFIQTGDVSNAGDWVTEYKSTYSEAGLAQSRLWPAGTLCITIAANIARVAILDFDACFPDSVVGFLFKEGVTNEYILYCLRFYQEYFEFRAPKSAQMNINLEILRQLKIPNPPEHLQKEFSEVVRSVRNLEENINRQLNKHHELLNEIFIAAFSGELTETWRNKNQTQIQAEAEARAERLALTAKPQTPVKPPTAAKKSSPAQSRPARLALFGELSEFQRFVFDALHEWPAGILIPDDSAAFEDFCRQWPVEHERNTQERARRALDQLAALGLIAKVSLPNPQGQYLTAYRMLREGDERRTGDIAAIGRSREMA